MQLLISNEAADVGPRCGRFAANIKSFEMESRSPLGFAPIVRSRATIRNKQSLSLDWNPYGIRSKSGVGAEKSVKLFPIDLRIELRFHATEDFAAQSRPIHGLGQCRQ